MNRNLQPAVTGSAAASPAPAGQNFAAPAQKPQQGQVKLTMAQLMQLTQGAQVKDNPFFI